MKWTPDNPLRPCVVDPTIDEATSNRMELLQVLEKWDKRITDLERAVAALEENR